MKLQLVAASVAVAAALDPARVLPTPPMGYNNWARFQTDLSERLFMDTADKMRALGLLAAGYDRINLDDAWSQPARARNGSMAVDLAKFPRGLAWLATSLRRKGFKPGIYTDAGRTSCAGFPGALDHEARDMADFRAWGFEYLKMDGCNLPSEGEAVYREVYARWARLVNETTDPPVVFSNSAPAYFSGRDNLTDWYTVMGWAARAGHLARHSADIQVYPSGDAWASMLYNYGMHVRLARFQRPGFFNDGDFLNIDHPGYTLEERKTHFALWCALSAPLIISADMQRLLYSEVSYLTNRDLVAMNQDALAQQATLVSRDDTFDVLSKSLSNGNRVVVIFNKSSAPRSLHVAWKRLGFDSLDLARLRYVETLNVWTGRTARTLFFHGLQVEDVPAHGTAVLRVTWSNGPVTPTGIVLNTASLACLADTEAGSVRFGTCVGTDAQTWGVWPDGRLRSMMRIEACLYARGDGVVAASADACKTARWKYHVSGNLVDEATKLCLTQDPNNAAIVARCENVANGQVFGLPVGVKVHGL